MSDRRQQFRAVFLAAIMVISMVGLGFAGFAGSAAAQDLGDDIDDASIVADNATSTEGDAIHVVRVDVADGDLGSDDSLEFLNITYSEDVSFDVSAGSDLGGDVDLYIDDTELTSNTESVEANDGENYLELSGLSGATSAPADFADTTITVVIDGVDNPSDTDADVGIELEDDNDGESTTEGLELGIDEDAPIEVLDDDGETVGYYGLLELETGDDDAAADAIDGEDNSLEVSGVVDNNDPTLTEDAIVAAGNDGLIDIGTAENGLSVEGVTDDAEIIFGDDGQDVDLIHLDAETDNVDISGLTVDASEEAQTAVVGANTGVYNLTVENNDFVDFDDPVLNIEFDDDDDPTTLEISGNSIDATDDGIVVRADAPTQEGTTVDISNNDAIVLDASGSEAGIELTHLGADVDVDLEGNVIEGSGDEVAIDLSSSDIDENVTVTEGSIDNVDIGVNIAPDSDVDIITVDGTEFTNITGTANNGGAILVDNIDEEVLIDGVDILDSDTGDGVVIDDGDATVDVLNSVINDTDEGIVINDVAVATVSDTDVDNTDGDRAIYVDQPGAGSEVYINESTSLDQAENDGIEVDLANDPSTDERVVEIDDVTVNGTVGAAVEVTGLDHDSEAVTLNITDSTFSESGTGVNVVDVFEADAVLNAHFNTFEENDEGIVVPGDLTADATLNFQFNDYVDNENNGLELTGSSGDGVVDANFSWWNNRDYSRITSTYSPQYPRLVHRHTPRVYEYTRLHTEGGR